MFLNRLKVGTFIAPDYRSSLGQCYYHDFCKKFKIAESEIVMTEMNLTKNELRKIWKERFSDAGSLTRALCSPQLQSAVCGYRVFTYNEKLVPYPSHLAPCVGTVSAELANFVICERLSPYEVRISNKEFRLGSSIKYCRKRLLDSYYTNTYFYIIDFQTSKAFVISVSYEDCNKITTLDKDTQICAELINYNFLVKGEVL